MIRNLTAAEPSLDPALDGLMDSALPEQFRGALPTVRRLSAFRETVAERVHARIGDIATGKVSAPTQLSIVATCLLTALINHEYQHDQWISEVRADQLGHALPADPESDHVRRIEGYLVLHPGRVSSHGLPFRQGTSADDGPDPATEEVAFSPASPARAYVILRRDSQSPSKSGGPSV